MRSVRASWTAAVVVVVVLIGAALVVLRRGTDGATAEPTAGATAMATAAGSEGGRPRVTPPADPNDGWFVDALPGAQMKANEAIDDPDLFPLFLADAEADVYRRNGVRIVRMRSYYAGASGGAVIEVIGSDHPRRIMRGLDHLGRGLGRPYPELNDGHISRRVVQMESTRAHDVFAHFYTITFVRDRYVVIVEAYGVADPVGRRRAVTYAARQDDLLRARAAQGDP